jgi:hypothetical protein
VDIPKEFSTLAPGQQWRTFWDWSPARAKHPALKDEKRVTLTFTYLGVNKEELTEESTLDWATVEGRMFGEKRTMHHAAQAIIRIANVVAPKPRKRVPLPHQLAAFDAGVATHAPAPSTASPPAPMPGATSIWARLRSAWRARFDR